MCVLFPPEQTAATSRPSSHFIPCSSYGSNLLVHLKVTRLCTLLSLSLSPPHFPSPSFSYMSLNNLMLQLSDGQASNTCFPSLLRGMVDFWPQIRALSPHHCRVERERGGGGNEERREGGREGGDGGKCRVSEKEKEREREKNECHGELKSLVASPLHWLPRDQRGAKSTQGRKK